MIALRTFDLGLSAVLTLLGLYIVWQGRQYGYQEGNVPGAGFFPLWIGAGLALFSFLNFVRALRHSGLLGTVETMEVARVLLVSLAIGGFVVLAAPIGMIAASVPLMIVIGVIFGARDIRSVLAAGAISVAMAGMLYLVFGLVLGMPLL